MSIKKTRTIIALLSVTLVLCALAGCGAGGSGKTGSGQPKISYSIYLNDEYSYSKFSDNPNDVVTPYIQNKFNIEVGDIHPISSGGQSLKERLNLWIASDTVPDVFLSTTFELDDVRAMGIFQPLDEYIEKYPNLSRFFDPAFWPLYTRDDKKYFIPCATIPIKQDDPYQPGQLAHAMWVREDILSMAGYSFEPLESIAARTTEAGKKPTFEDFAISPPIKTSDDLYILLKKIKGLNLTVNGKPLYPLDIRPSYQFHLGCMMGFGWYQKQDDGSVGGYLGLKGAKDWYKFLRKLYQEELLDPDFMVQKDEQLQEKCAEGRVAVGFNIADIDAARDAMAQINPDAKIRYIEWPKDNPTEGYFDIYTPAWSLLAVNKDYKDIDRLMAMFDWMRSDEGLDILSWGPESAGLWEVKDGVKKFKDSEVESAFLNYKLDAKGPDYYGLYDSTKDLSPFWSKIGNCQPYVVSSALQNSYVYSYPPKLDIYTVNRIVGVGGLNMVGTATYGEGENCDATTNYFWGDFYSITSAKLFEAKTDADFEAAWNEIYADFLDKGKYDAAVRDVTAWLDKYGAK